MAVAESEETIKFSQELRDYFKSLDLNFILFPLNQEKKYKSLNAFYDFVLKQHIYWNDCKSGITNQIRNHFKNIIHYLDQAVNNQDQNLNQSKNLISNAVKQIRFNRFPCVFISPESDFIKEQYRIHPERADAACEYLLGSGGNGRLNITPSNLNHYDGLINSFFYKYPNLQNKIFKSIDESYQDIKKHYIESLNEVDNNYFIKIEEVTEYNNDFKQELTSWKDDLTSSTHNFVEAKKNELEELKDLYEEKIRLEAPAKYWEETGEEYEQKGKRWIVATLVSATVFICFLTYLLFELPVSNISLDLNSLKIIVILTVIISVGLFLINFFIRLSTSAYHLSRDAKERNKLTIVYLALLKEKGLEESDRSIILQSLFSRADTGLLKGDSSPTLPDGLIGQVMKNLGHK